MNHLQNESHESHLDKEAKKAYAKMSHYYDFGRSGRGTIKLIEDTELRAIRENFIVKPNSKILEIGCGTGRIISLLSLGGINVGIDFTFEMLEKAKNRLSNIPSFLLNGNAKFLPFKSSTFDLTYSYKVLPHIPNVQQAISEISRVTKKGGVIVLEFYNALNIRRFYPYKYYTEWHTPWEARSLVEGTLLKIKKVYGAGTTIHLNKVCKIPGVFEGIRFVDRKLATSFFNNLAAFYILVCEKIR